MSMYFMKHKKRFRPEYGPGRTKQAFKDSCDINKILKKAWKTGAVSHLNRFEPFYGDFADFDFKDAQNQLAKGREIFEHLPAELRREFATPEAFFGYVNDPKNSGRLNELMPQLAAPGRQYIVPGQGRSQEPAKAPKGSESIPPSGNVESAPSEANPPASEGAG